MYSRTEALQVVYLPDGTIFDEESIGEDNILDPDFEPVVNQDDDGNYLSDSSVVEEQISQVTKTVDSILNVEVHKSTVPQEDTNHETNQIATDQPGPSTSANRQQFTWRQRKPASAEVDPNYAGAYFSPPPNQISSPKWYFDHFMDRSVFELMAEQSNLYAAEKNTPLLNSTLAEMEQFSGMHILMTVVRMPSYHKYWEKPTRYEPIAGVMGRKRFDHLRTYLHLNNNDSMKQKDEPGYDPIFKFCPVLEKVRQNCLKIEPHEKHSVDEQMIPNKGRIGMKQYVKNQPCKWGIKVLFRADIRVHHLPHKIKNVISNLPFFWW